MSREVEPVRRSFCRRGSCTFTGSGTFGAFWERAVPGAQARKGLQQSRERREAPHVGEEVEVRDRDGLFSVCSWLILLN